MSQTPVCRGTVFWSVLKHSSQEIFAHCRSIGEGYLLNQRIYAIANIFVVEQETLDAFSGDQGLTRDQTEEDTSDAKDVCFQCGSESSRH